MKPDKIERRPSNEERLEMLRYLFPEVLADGRVHLERLREFLEDGASDAPDREHYGLRWPGQKQARRIANQPPHVTLRRVPNAGVDEETTGNMVLVGDNLQILLALQKSYANAIKLVYIDPPYNTGNDFIYKDTFAIDEELYLQETRQADLHGRLVSNPQTSGRFHSSWLNFMYPRLSVARRLMREDGLLFVSINDREVVNLRMMLNEIFGEENFIAQIVVQSNKRGQTYKEISQTHEYLLVFSKGPGAEINELPKDGDALPYQDSKGSFDLWELRNRNPKFGKHNRPNLYYPIYVAPSLKDESGYSKISLHCDKDFTVKVYPLNSEGKEGCWRWGQQKVSESDISSSCPDLVARQKKDGGWNVYERSRKSTTKAKSLWTETDVISEQGTVSLGKLGLGDVFDHPKPVGLLSKVLSLAMEDEDTVLDFFAGSGTTGEALFRLNGTDNSQRKFILVQLDVPVDQKTAAGANAARIGLDTIDKITCERLRRVSREMKAEGAKGDLGFRVFREDSPALARPLHLATEHLESGQLVMFKERLAHMQPADLFSEVQLLLGYPLNSKREQVPQDSANTLWRFEHPGVPQPLLLCLDQKVDDDLLDALRDKRNHMFVCRDEALTDVSKARFYDALKLVDSTFKVL
jgi:adenine-specific DNA-methyltransferase